MHHPNNVPSFKVDIEFAHFSKFILEARHIHFALILVGKTSLKRQLYNSIFKFKIIWRRKEKKSRLKKYPHFNKGKLVVGFDNKGFSHKNISLWKLCMYFLQVFGFFFCWIQFEKKWILLACRNFVCALSARPLPPNFP